MSLQLHESLYEIHTNRYTSHTQQIARTIHEHH